jgi:SAM-dependent methyltransferase
VQTLKRRYRFFRSYHADPPWDTNISPPELLDFLTLHIPGRALDIGCGTGTNLIGLAKYGWQAEGIDYIHKAVRKARQKLQDKNLTIPVYHGDFLTSTKVRGPYDLILDIGCYHSFPDENKRRYENKIAVLLAKPGYFLIHGYLKSDSPRRGITQKDIELFSTRFHVEFAERGTGLHERPSIWMLFRRE